MLLLLCKDAHAARRCSSHAEILHGLQLDASLAKIHEAGRRLSKCFPGTSQQAQGSGFSISSQARGPRFVWLHVRLCCALEARALLQVPCGPTFKS